TSAGGGMVECTINGKKEIVSLNIKPEAVDPEDVEILQDMIIGAVNEAIRKVEEIHSAEMEKITNGLSLPGIF
ncbi:MAG: YbaB/EbfC family nucleoid-associated protein, partial [Porphyromonadaceae bacterium]|nr:YbaB/EbfC family nucleoid-associated protein [Porphyromonadaceae bacterium]